MRIFSALAIRWAPAQRDNFRAGLGDALIVAEDRSSDGLTCAAGVAMRSLHNLLNVNVGFAAEHVLTLRMVPPPPRCRKPRTRTYRVRSRPQETQIANAMALRQSMIETVQGIPGVEFAAETESLPLDRTPTLWALH